MPLQITGEITLVTHRPTLAGNFTVALHQHLREAVPTWGRSTRTSPLFKTSQSEIPSLTGKRKTKIYFVGPIRPERLPADVNLFLSYGIYNCVIFAQGAKQIKAAEAFLNGLQDIPWEKWDVEGNIVVYGDYSNILLEDKSQSHPNSRVQAQEILRSAGEEYQALIAVTRARCASYLPDLSAELDVLDKTLGEKIRNVDLHAVRKLQWLVNINAALSRFSSQTFAGTSPILGTECHFWTHSLLGIGIATKALLQFRRYVDARAGQAQFAARISEFKKAAPAPKRLSKLSVMDEWWSHAKLPPLPSKASATAAQQLPLIVCFSGRDGFKSTTFTLSAPLEVLQSANTYAWSLHTLTHELSHIFVESILAALLEDDYETAAWSNRVLDVFQETREAANLHEQLQEQLIFSSVSLELEDSGKEEYDVTDEDPKRLFQKHYYVISEILAHIFDFLHFFQQDTVSYIRSVWSSWDVIPNIESRVPEYIIRSLCALHINNLSIRNGVDASIDNLLNDLKTLSKANPKNQYISIAATQLENNREDFKRALGRRIPLIKLARVLMYSPEVAAIFGHTRAESRRSAKSFSGYKPKQFIKNRPVDNPIRFILEHCSDLRADAPKALWVLMNLAFSGDLDD